MYVRVVLLFMLLQWGFLMANDTDSISPHFPKRYFFIEGGVTFNSSSLYSLSGTTSPNFELKPLRAFGLGIGYAHYFKKITASVTLRRVSLGDLITMKSFPSPSQLPGVFISGYKNNFLLGFSGGYQLQLKKLSIHPTMGIAISLNPPLNSNSMAYVTGGNDTILMARSMRLTSGTLLFATTGLSVTYPVRISSFDFSVGLSCSYALGLLSGYSSTTSFKYQTNEYTFKVANKGTHVMYALQMVFPLDE